MKVHDYLPQSQQEQNVSVALKRTDRQYRRALEHSTRTAEDHHGRKTHGRLGRLRPRASDAERARRAAMEAKAILRSIKTLRLASECPEVRSVSAYFPNALKLSTATTEQMHSIPGCGPVKRRKIKAYLASKGVNVGWEA